MPKIASKRIAWFWLLYAPAALGSLFFWATSNPLLGEWIYVSEDMAILRRMGHSAA